MKKNLFFHFSVLAMLIVLISACSSKKSEYTNVIPSDASQVIAVNLKSLADKAGTKDKETKEALQKLTDALKSDMNERIPLEEYVFFARSHFERNSKTVETEAIIRIYRQFEGGTWYIQKVLNVLYDMTPPQGVCRVRMAEEAIRQIVGSFRYTYSEILFRMPEKQKELLIAITKEREAKAITSGAFIKKYKLLSASLVQSALKGLLEKEFITHEAGVYKIYDRFLGICLVENYKVYQPLFQRRRKIVSRSHCF